MQAGKNVWIIPDGHYPGDGIKDKYNSHEAICVINTGDIDATIRMTLYFEDREPVTNFSFKCAAKRSNHLRLDVIKDEKGQGIPRQVNYSMLLESDQPVICQYSRCDTTQLQMSLMTTMAYACD